VSAPIRVGHIDLSFHNASALEVEAVLAKYGHAVERSAAPHEEMFQRMSRRDVDILVSAWLPASHGKYLEPFRDEVEEVTVLYEPYCIWGVPDNVPTSISQILDLLQDAALNRMDRLIQGINPGAGISRLSSAIITTYKLDHAGYHFRPGTEQDCFGRFEEAVAQSRWVVVPLWHPQALHHRYKIRALAEPLGLSGGADKATVIIRREAAARIESGALDELRRLYIGNARMSELDDALRRAQGLDEKSPIPTVG